MGFAGLTKNEVTALEYFNKAERLMHHPKAQNSIGFVSIWIRSEKSLCCLTSFSALRRHTNTVYLSKLTGKKLLNGISNLVNRASTLVNAILQSVFVLDKS
jgi:hypothetical protein